jgi:hypothetical protein
MAAPGTVSPSRQAGLLAVNFVLTIAIINVNKHIFVAHSVKLPVTLTAFHYILTCAWSCWRMPRRMTSIYSPRVAKLTFPMIVALCGAQVRLAGSCCLQSSDTSCCMPQVLSNMSLSKNSMGTSQIIKLMMIPLIVALEYHCANNIQPGTCHTAYNVCTPVGNGRCVSFNRAALLVCAACAIIFSVASDLDFNVQGVLVGLLTLPFSAVNKVRRNSCGLFPGPSTSTHS